eukprot:COSAG02_NODE_7401_length_3034_cov_3.660307_1_plen_179_part_10
MTGQRPFVDSVAKCLTSIVANNETLCIRYAVKLTETVRVLAKTGTLSLDLIALLQTLLVSKGQTVAPAQIAVCKGASTSEHLIELTGTLGKNEAQGAPHLDRTDVFIKGLKEQGDQTKRCQGHLQYYSQCLQLLGICARGKMPSTELLCASLIPFAEVVKRLHEVFNPDLVPQDLTRQD